MRFIVTALTRSYPSGWRSETGNVVLRSLVNVWGNDGHMKYVIVDLGGHSDRGCVAVGKPDTGGRGV